MNYFNVSLFYGLGISVEAVTDFPQTFIDEDTEEETPMLFNGILFDFLCFRIIIGRMRDYDVAH